MVAVGFALSIVLAGVSCKKDECHTCTKNDGIVDSEVITCNDDTYKEDLESQGYACVKN